MPLPKEFQELVGTERPRKKRKAQPESWVKDKIKDAVRDEAPGAYMYMPVQGAEGENGIPDFIACVPIKVTPEMVGRTVPLFVGIEAKADDGELSPIQKICHKKMRSAKAIIWVVKGAEGVKDLIDKLRALTHASR